MITAVIFDMNGVIIDDEPLHEQAFREVLQSIGVTLSHEAYQKHFLGRSDLAGMEHLNEKQPLPKPLDELYKQKMKRYWQLSQAGIPLMPGIVETIKNLTASFRLALTTGATKLEVDTVVAEHNLAQYFDILITTENFSKSKPDPEPYLLTATKLGVSPQKCVVIEDAIAGIEAAHGAGMKCIAITNSFTTAQLKKADKIIDSAAQITPQLINNL